MGLKKLSLFFSITLLFSSLTFSQNSINNVKKDTVTFSEENTNKVIEFGEYISNTIHTNDVDSFLSKLNKPLFFERVLKQIPKENHDDEFSKGFLLGLTQTLSTFPNEIISEVENGSYYDFISYRYDTEAQTYYALFRLYSAETGMNYHDYRVHKVNNDIQFSDMYVYLTGEHFTQTLGRMMAYSLPDKKGLIKSPVENEFIALSKAIMYNNNGEFEKSYEVMNGIKSEISKEKFLIIFKALVASNVDEEKYLKSLEELIHTFPEDPTIGLNRIDYHIYKGEYFEAIQVVNQLQNETEDDFLNYIKACIAYEDKNYDLALNLFQYTIENYTDFFEGQAGYLNTLVQMKNYPEAVNYLNTLISEGYEKPSIIEYIEEDDEYGQNILEAFSKSKDFKTWKKKKD